MKSKSFISSRSKEGSAKKTKNKKSYGSPRKNSNESIENIRIIRPKL